jgi:predicted DNA-binding ribbon-helix-helix protein
MPDAVDAVDLPPGYELPARRVTLSELVANIGGGRKQSNLSSAIRQFVLEYFQNAKKRVDEIGYSAHCDQ